MFSNVTASQLFGKFMLLHYYRDDDSNVNIDVMSEVSSSIDGYNNYEYWNNIFCNNNNSIIATEFFYNTKLVSFHNDNVCIFFVF